MKFPRRKPARMSNEEIATAINRIITDLRKNPIKVDHTVSRNIPRPTRMWFVVENNEGRRYQTISVDLSYKNGIPVTIPVSWLYPDAPASAGVVTLTAMLEYDPKDR